MNIINNISLRKDKWILFGYCTIIFLVLFTFFSQMHPLVIFNTDDWQYISQARKAFPIWKDWNPTRVLPEILMPLCAMIGVGVIMPITNDYVGSITLVFNIVICLAIVIYIYSFIRFFITKFQLSLMRALPISFLFLVFHFLIFRNADENNLYMFYSENATNYFYYTIPSILNIIMLFYLELHPELLDVRNNKQFGKKGIMLIGIYFCVFSNLFSAYILAIYAGVKMLFQLFGEVKEKRFVFGKYIINNLVYEIILMFWFVSHIFEVNGGRAKGARLLSIWDSVGMVIRYLVELCGKMNCSFVLTCFVIVIAAFLTWIVHKKKNDCEKINLNFFLGVLLCSILSGIYLILLCAGSVMLYITRPDAILGMIFFAFMFICGALVYVINSFKKIYVVMPLLITILFFQVNTSYRVFKDSYYKDLDASTCIAIDNDIIEQIIQADKAGLEEMNLYLPSFAENVDNWPLALYANDRFTKTLHKHGLISRRIEVTIVLDEEKNREFHLQ